MSAWPVVKLGEVLRPHIDAVPSAQLNTVNLAGVYGFGRGLFPRGPIAPIETTYKHFHRLNAGDFVISSPKAWEGAVTRIPEEFDGWFLSPVFPTFRADTERLDTRYLDWYCKRDTVWRQLQGKAKGMGARRESVSPNQFLSIEIPLPPLPEQRRIVARIEELAAQINEAKGLRKQTEEETEALFVNQIGKIFTQLSSAYSPRHFGSFSPHVTSGPRNWAKHYEQTGLRFYRAQDIGPKGNILNDSKVFITPPPGDQGRTAKLYDGDLMIVITGATVGRVSVYRQELEPGFVSQHVAICRLPQDEIIPEFALWGLRGPMGQTQLLGQRYGQGKPGLNLTNIRALSLPVPPLSEQRRIVAELDALQAEVDALKRLQAETAAELDALLPAVLDRAFKGEL